MVEVKIVAKEIVTKRQDWTSGTKYRWCLFSPRTPSVYDRSDTVVDLVLKKIRSRIMIKGLTHTRTLPLRAAGPRTDAAIEQRDRPSFRTFLSMAAKKLGYASLFRAMIGIVSRNESLSALVSHENR